MGSDARRAAGVCMCVHVGVCAYASGYVLCICPAGDDKWEAPQDQDAAECFLQLQLIFFGGGGGEGG